MKSPYPLFTRYGVELEYMLVDEKTLNVSPMADTLIYHLTGNYGNHVSRGALEWSNELTLHVMELKTSQPAKSLTPLAQIFQEEIQFLNRYLQQLGHRLLPTAMHPWMNPKKETKLWPHENGEVYAMFDRIFDCHRHGWSNLQSVHLNLPFATEEEFLRLHTAIRLILAILPGLTASSPFMNGKVSPYLDSRLEMYRHHCDTLTFLTGHLIPEPIRSQAEYETRILKKISKVLEPHNPDGVLRPEWSNARGAIARFERNTIEIRVMDIQECPHSDIAILNQVVAVLKTLAEQTHSTTAQQLLPRTSDLERVLIQVIQQGNQTVINQARLLEGLGFTEKKLSLQEIWTGLHERTSGSGGTSWKSTLKTILKEGNLAQRLLKAAGPEPSKQRLHEIYSQLADCLNLGKLFLPQ